MPAFPGGGIAAVGGARMPVVARYLRAALAGAGLTSVAGGARVAILARLVLDDGPRVGIGARPAAFAGTRISRAAGFNAAAADQAARDELADAASLVRVARVGGAVQAVIAVSRDAIGA